ncbi:MAG: hypothetical protein AAFV19_11640 [Pseudomonadota bacterium]
MSIDTPPQPTIVPGRSCEDCAMCCYMLKIDALDKPGGQWCQHCPTKKSCGIHGQHPQECRDFLCGYLTVASLDEAWKPSKSKIIMAAELDGQRMTAIVDPARPDAWRKAPYYDQLKSWAEAAAHYNGQVVVRIGQRYWVILPDRDVDLGEVSDDEVIVTEITQTPTGKTLNALKLPRTDPRAAGLA